MTTSQETTPHLYAKFEPCDPELFDNLQGKFSLCYLGPSGDDVTICAHWMRLDEDHRLKVNPALGDPPSVRAKGAFRLYREAADRFLRHDIDLSAARALYIPAHGNFVQVPLDDFKSGHADKMREQSAFLRQPYYDETMRRCAVGGEPFPPVPFGCETLGDDACRYYLDPLTGEPVVISGAAPSLVGLPSGALVGTNDAALIEAGEQWRKRPSAFGLN